MIRAARPGDAGAIAAVWNPIIRDTAITFRPDPWSEPDLRGWIAAKADAGHGVLVAEDGGAVLGFAAYGQLRAGAGYRRTVEHTLMLAPRRGAAASAGPCSRPSRRMPARAAPTRSGPGSARRTPRLAPSTPPAATPRSRGCPRSATSSAAGSTWS